MRDGLSEEEQKVYALVVRARAVERENELDCDGDHGRHIRGVTDAVLYTIHFLLACTARSMHSICAHFYATLHTTAKVTSTVYWYD